MADKGINIKVDEEFYKEIKIRIVLDGISLKDYIIKLIKQDLEKRKK